MSQNEPDSAQGLRALHGKFPGSRIYRVRDEQDQIRWCQERGQVARVARVCRIETVVSLYDFVTKVKGDGLMTPVKTRLEAQVSEKKEFIEPFIYTS